MYITKSQLIRIIKEETAATLQENKREQILSYIKNDCWHCPAQSKTVEEYRKCIVQCVINKMSPASQYLMVAEQRAETSNCDMRGSKVVNFELKGKTAIATIEYNGKKYTGKAKFRGNLNLARTSAIGRARSKAAKECKKTPQPSE